MVRERVGALGALARLPLAFVRPLSCVAYAHARSLPSSGFFSAGGRGRHIHHLSSLLSSDPLSALSLSVSLSRISDGLKTIT